MLPKPPVCTATSDATTLVAIDAISSGSSPDAPHASEADQMADLAEIFRSRRYVLQKLFLAAMITVSTR